MRFYKKILVGLFFVLLFQNFLFADDQIPYELQEVGVEEHLGSKISTDLEFTDESGSKVPLSKFFDQQHPVILNLVYFGCPNICGFLLNGFTAGLKQMAWIPGNEFQVLTISIDPTEKSELANEKKKNYFKEYGKPEAEKGWHFLTGTEDQIKKLASEVGFKYKYDTDQKQYAHGAVIFVLTPEGKISRYLYGIEFNPRDLKLALLEASEGKIGNVVDRFLMFCYHYDPKGKKYALFATRLMRGAAVFTVIFLGLMFYRLNRKKRG